MLQFIDVPITITRRNKMDYKKDYSLLRPFDLEAAKLGDAIIENTPFGFKVKLMGALSNGRKVLVEFEYGSGGERYAEDIKMAPLAWVEGKPVYRGDVLWQKGIERKASGASEDGNCIFVDSGFVNVLYLTWQKPKTKREGWVNIYPNGDVYIHPSKKVADENSDLYRVDCVRIEWDE